MTDPILSVEGLTKRFNGMTAVNRISFQVRPGEIVGLLGPNGAGKTTTIHMLLSLITPTAGRIRVFGLDLTEHREEILLKTNFTSAYVAMPYNLTVEQNLVVFARLYNLPDPRAAVDRVVRQVGLEEQRRQATRMLSTGQASRLNLAKAFLNEPRLLLLDEPTASLDPDVANRVRQILLTLRRDHGVAMLYTSHNMPEVEQMCDRIIFLQKGDIVAEDTPAGLIRRYGRQTLEEVFLKIAREEPG